MFQFFKLPVSSVVLCLLQLLYKPKKATHSSKPEEDYVKNDLNFLFNSFPYSQGDKALVTQLGGLLFRARAFFQWRLAPATTVSAIASTIVAR